MKTEAWEYDVKCRRCGNICRMHHSSQEQINKNDFKTWAMEHSSFPIQKQCSCDNGMMMLHDLVSFGPIFNLF